MNTHASPFIYEYISLLISGISLPIDRFLYVISAPKFDPGTGHGPYM